MSNDYVLFIIILPNDSGKEISLIPVKSPTASTGSIDVISTHEVPAGVSRPSIGEKDIGKHSRQNSIQSLCATLKGYLSSKENIEAVWMLSANQNTYQVTFYVEFGLISDRLLQDLTKLGIGRSNETKIFVLPTAFIIEGHMKEKNEYAPKLSLTGDIMNGNELPVNSTGNDTVDSAANDVSLSRKIRKRITSSDFKKSVRARLMVHQVVASIRAATALSFDFVLLLCLASMLAAFGLLEDSTVIIVASMLVSPLMNPILGIVFGLSIREHSLWRRGCRNELIGLILCVICGFILGLFTTFAETSWGNSTSFPTPEMKSRGDVRRIWVGVLIALPSGAGVALSVLGGNTGSLVGVAISASLLPPAVNSGLLFAYSLLSYSVASIAATHSPSINNTNSGSSSNLNCAKYINNDYQPLYTCNLAAEVAILGCCSLLLTIVNIICIIIMALFILRIKEVVPLHQPNQDITNFFHYDVKVARDYNKINQEEDLQSNPISTSTLSRNNLTQSIVNRWKTFKSATPREGQRRQETEQATSTNNETQSIDTDTRRDLLHLKTFAKEYDLDPLNKSDYDLLTTESREKVRLLISDLVDMCQEIPPAFVGLFPLQPYATQPSIIGENIPLYEEIIRLLPPKWYQLFVQEQKRRQLMSWSSSLNRTYSLGAPRYTPYNQSSSSRQENPKTKKIQLQRQISAPAKSPASLDIHQETQDEIPIEGTRFRVARPSIITETLDDKVETV